MTDTGEFVPGLRRNWQQFLLLVIVNAFVGGMVGMERSVLPLIGAESFGIFGTGSLLSFIAVFGVSKAVANYFTGKLANRTGRRNLLLAGWIIALPLPFILMWATEWHWIVIANALLGVHQGLAWSSTVVMKMDLVNEKERGLAMGLNEFAGYLAVAGTAYFTASVAAEYGLRPYPFYIGIFLVVLGLLFTLFLVRDTTAYVTGAPVKDTGRSSRSIFLRTTLTDKNLSAITQAGFVNNLNDGMVWGLLPVVLLARSYTLTDIGLIAGVYPAVWGITQIITGKLTDRFGRKTFLVWGMVLQGLVLPVYVFGEGLAQLLAASSLLGLGTAMVYPTFLAAIADNTSRTEMAESVGVFRLWRDLGYAAGALLTGVIALYASTHAAIITIAGLTVLSGMWIALRFKEVTRDEK